MGRFSRDDRPAQPRTRVNYMIRITPIRVIGPENEQIGVVETAEALKMAQERGLDLVEIVPDSRPPVCKIMDYGKYKYELSQKARKSRAASKSTEMKEVRLGRSIKIGDHDVLIRINQSRRFLMAGHKVMVTQRFKGREIAHKDLGIDKLRDVADALADIAKVEQTPRWMGKQASIILAPDKAKVESLKRKLEKERQEAIARGEIVPDEPEIDEDELLDEVDDDHDEHDDDGDEGPDAGPEGAPVGGQGAPQSAASAPGAVAGKPAETKTPSASTPPAPSAAEPASGPRPIASPAPARISGPRPASGGSQQGR